MSDFSSLPAISFCETDGSAVEQRIINEYEKISGVSLAAGDPVRLFLEGIIYTIVVQRQVIDLTGKQNMLAYAAGDKLDHLGVLTDTPRLEAYTATTTIRFSLGEIQDSAVIIPAGTRITPDNKLMFVTETESEIAGGTLYTDVIAVCETGGTAGNGFIAGQINRLVDPVAGVTKAANTVTSLGGAEIEADERYRSRVQLSPEKASVAGPSGKYIYWAESAHQDIANVAVLSPVPGAVDIIVLMKNGELPTQVVLDAVNSAVSSEDVRPLTDNVSVLVPEQVEYTIDGTYYIATSNSTIAANIQSAVDKTIDDFILWQRSALGRDINTAELIYRLRSAGVKRVALSNPADTIISKRQVAVLKSDGLNLVYGGLEDE